MIKQFGIYSIHSDGKVWSNKHNKFLKPSKDEKGYLRIGLYINGKSKTYKLHRLIAEMFIPKIEGKTQVNHINGIKTDNYIENLEWCNNSENQQHAWNNGLNTSSYKKVVLDTQTGVFYDSATELANLIGVKRSTLISHLNGHRNVYTKYQYA
jgi:hypothetical protein